jgi:hypothetical protein
MYSPIMDKILSPAHKNLYHTYTLALFTKTYHYTTTTTTTTLEYSRYNDLATASKARNRAPVPGRSNSLSLLQNIQAKSASCSLGAHDCFLLE